MVLAGLEEVLHDVFALLAAGLGAARLVVVWREGDGCAYTDDGDFCDAVLLHGGWSYWVLAIYVMENCSRISWQG